MDTVALALVTATSLVTLVLAGLIFIRNPRGKVNKVFVFFALSIVAWTLFNFLADNAASYNLLLTRLTFVAGVPIALSLYLLSVVSPEDRLSKKHKVTVCQAWMSLLIGLICVTPYLVPSVTKGPSGVDLKIGPAYPLYLVYILQALIIVIINFISSFKTATVSGRVQIKLLLSGILGYAMLTIASNLLAPLIVNNWSSSRFGPIFTLVFIAFTAYAIVRHRFLDIRLIVARSLVYVLLLTTTAAAYGLLTFGIAIQVFGENRFSERVIPIGMAVFLVFTVQPLRVFFARITNRFFFKDAYDTQAFLDQFNRLLVSTYDLDLLLKGAAGMISDNLKPTYCAFVLRNGANHIRPLASVGTSVPVVDEKAVAIFRKVLGLTREKVIVTDFMLENHDQFKQILQRNNISALTWLTVNIGKGESGTGYIILGPKKNGNLYSQQDVKVLEIIANELVIAIQNALRFEEIQNFAATLQGKVDEATKKLRHANERLKALDETKDDFISMASHQLRTPLTSVKGYISMVVEGDAGKINSKQKEMLGQAFFSSQRMVYLIADLLNVSRLRTGKFIIEPSRVNLAKMVEQEIEQLRETAASRKLTLTYDPPKEFPDMMLDETKTRQVIMNFVDNAIYYTPAGGYITVRLLNNPSTIELRVEDSGIGVAKAEQPHLFTKFFRAGNARKARPDGTGLGLFMAKKVVIAEGGSIIFESELGQGSTFGFVFSKNRTAVDAQSRAT